MVVKMVSSAWKVNNYPDMLVQVNDQKLKLAGPCTKEQSMTDRFEEALVAACMDAERTLSLVPNPLG